MKSILKQTSIVWKMVLFNVKYQILRESRKSPGECKEVMKENQKESPSMTDV
jgi:hypothetical protein